MSGVRVLQLHMRKAFRSRLQSIDGLPASVHWQGLAFSAVVGTPFMRERFRANGSTPRGLGKGGTISHRFLATVQVFMPTGPGAAEAAEEAAGRLLEAYAPGSALLYGGSVGLIHQAEIGPELPPEADWYGLPVTITIVAHSAT